MATIQTTAKTISNAQALEFVYAICEEYQYQNLIPNPLFGQEGQAETIANPQTKSQFAQARFDEFAHTWARSIVISYRKRKVQVSDIVEF